MIQTAFDTILDTDLEIGTTLICLGLSLLYGLILAVIYKYFKRSSGYSTDIPMSLIVLPVAIAGIVMVSRVIGLNSTSDRTTIAFSFAGVLALTRFRSTQHDISDLAFLSMTIILGFINGLGYILYAALVLVIMAIAIIIITVTKFNAPSIKEMTLKIIVPEQLNFDNLFDDILTASCKAYNLKSIRSTEFGTMFELNYVITLKNDVNQHEFIDKIRERNGNLNVTLSIRRFNTQIIQ